MINVTEPQVFQGGQDQLHSRDLDDWKTYLRWHLVHGKRPLSVSGFVQANFDFL